jgi:hypothetical protein
VLDQLPEEEARLVDDDLEVLTVEVEVKRAPVLDVVDLLARPAIFDGGVQVEDGDKPRLLRRNDVLARLGKAYLPRVLTAYFLKVEKPAHAVFILFVRAAV